jgi:Cu2+-exporting ATPase
VTALTLEHALAEAPTAVDAACAHCGLPTPAGRRFCCSGCAAAFETIQGLGLGRYYQQRLLDPALRAPRPEAAEGWDLSRSIATLANGAHELSLAIEGLQCGACVWLIESVLARDPAVQVGRINMTTRRLRLVWQGGLEDASRLVGRVEALGYRLVPFETSALSAAQDRGERALLRALAVAGFAAGNVMLISIGVWAGEAAGWLEGMGPATRDLLHWFSALIALPAIAYAGVPFFRSAFTALRHGRSNMDVPISIGVVLVTGMSLAESFAHGRHTYFDSAITLLFFLLIGRVLDHRARGQARSTAERLLAMRSSDVAVLQADGSTVRRAQQGLTIGDRILVRLGERIGADGVVERGDSPVDTSLVTGESLPVRASCGTAVFAGTLNLGEPLTVRATATGGTTLLAECVRLIEAAESRRSRFVVLADRVARRYAPVVHVTALLTFLGWYFGLGASLSQSLLTASAVLIITCPCALALAVPAVQVVATSRLFRAGVLLKSATALERLDRVDTVVFDKTGTLSQPALALIRDGVDAEALRLAAGLAVNSRHPLARSLVAAAGPVPAAEGVVEYPGQGLGTADNRLGSAAFCGCNGITTGEGPELWLTRPGQAPIRFAFQERLRGDAAETIARLRGMGLSVWLISGDRHAAVARMAAEAGIADFRAECSPVEKVAAIEALQAAGHHVLMVGDGLNDGPSLAAAHVSASPATAADISQTVADLVFQGTMLRPVADALRAARRARAAMRQNLVLSIGYNTLMVPLAIAGWVTPWLAALAMSSSSLLVMANSFRTARGSQE